MVIIKSIYSLKNSAGKTRIQVAWHNMDNAGAPQELGQSHEIGLKILTLLLRQLS
jgi:hypothetical protein